MNTKLDDNILMNMVFQCLCRVLKNRKIYHRFRCFIGNGKKDKDDKTFYRHRLSSIYAMLNCMQPYVLHAQEGDNPFFYTSNKEDIFNNLKQVIAIENAITNDNNKDVAKVQMRITQFLNTLLHYCVERVVGSISEVEYIGQTTFEMVCKKIYGDDFVDETEKNIPKDIKSMLDARREYIENNGMASLRDFSIDSRFIEFLKTRGIIDGHGNRRRPLRMTPSLERLEELSNERYHLGFNEWDEDDELEEIM